MDIIVNNKVTSFYNKKDALIFIMYMAISHSKYMPFLALKENINAASLLILEYCDLERERLEALPSPKDTETKKRRIQEKAYYSRLKMRVNRLVDFCATKKEVSELLTVAFNFILAIDGMPLLPGFSFTSKVHRDVPSGNAEYTSVTRGV